MSSSTPNLKFLLDENVRQELFTFLKDTGFDVKKTPKSSSDKTVAAISKTEKRILVTNDEDFCRYDSDSLFAVIWLRLPQNDSQALLDSFRSMLKTATLRRKLTVVMLSGHKEHTLGQNPELLKRYS